MSLGRIAVADLSAAESESVRRMRTFAAARRALEETSVACPPGAGAALHFAAAQLLGDEQYRPRHEVLAALRVETRNEGNQRGMPTGQRHHRAKLQRRDVPPIVISAFVGAARRVGKRPVKQVVLVTLTRESPGHLDDDGISSAMKHVRDAIARHVLEMDDADPRVLFQYHQRVAKRIEMSARFEWQFGVP